MVLRGQRAWGTIKATSAEQRQLWREVGEALAYGRALHTSNQAFGAWCKDHGFDMDARVRSDSMWLADNWGASSGFPNTTFTSPGDIRKDYREAASAALIPDLSLDLSESEQVTNVEAVASKAQSIDRLRKMATDTGPEGKEAARRHRSLVAHP